MLEPLSFPHPMSHCHGLDSADFFLQIIIGTALVLILSHPSSLCFIRLSDDSRACDGLRSTAFHEIPILGQLY
jgi:hypothetical protein